MALQVWLPFTDGTLKQQGLLNSNATVTGTTTFVVGKLGQALNCNGSSWWTIPNVTLGSNVSIACWSKTTTNSRMMWVLESDASEILNLFDYGEYYLNTGDSANNPYLTDAGSKITCLHDGEWHHFVVTFNGTQSLLYIDGEYKGKAKTYRNPTTTNKNLKIGGGYRNAHSYDWSGALNDFRLYDHCLSPMEVKQLSQGLILHYPLNRQGWGQENLIKEANALNLNRPFTNSDYSSRGAYVTCPANTNTIVLAQTGTFNCYRWFNGHATLLSITSEELLTPGQPWVFSLDIKSGVQGKFNLWMNIRTTNSDVASPNIIGNAIVVNGTDLPSNWTRYWVSITPRAEDSARVNLLIGISGEATTNGTIYFKNLKFEKGTIMTPWCPSNTETLATTMGLNSTTEYDCSGFCNNSIRNANTTYSSNTPKYSVSTFWGAVNTPKATLNDASILSSLTNCTVAWWENCTTTGNTLLFSGQTQYYYIGAGNNSNPLYDYNIGTSGITLYKDGVAVNTSYSGQRVNHTGTYHIKDEWHHYVLTGVNLSAWTTFIINGYSSWPLNAYVSDIRIYATALSASDVKSLYQNCATIDPDGTIRGQIRS